MDDILLAEEEETYALIDKMFSSIAAMYSTRRVNIGMDEAYLLGAGKYLYRHGFRDKTQIMLGHLRRSSALPQSTAFIVRCGRTCFSMRSAEERYMRRGGRGVPDGWEGDGFRAI